MAYAEDLQHMSAEDLDEACKEARKTSEFMPVSAAIIQAHERLLLNESEEYLGVRQIDYPPVTQEERDGALEFSQKLKDKLVQMEEREKKIELQSPPEITTSIYHEGYRMWLNEQQELDEQARAMGLDPVRRSEEERLAIFYNLPLVERKRMRRKAAWTKTVTKNM